MRRDDREATSNEVVIVRRRGGDENEGHHSGAWKIAFADFMTALMTFFLVMWLINSTDKKSLTQIATYFNPLKLTDKVTRTKGIRDLETGAEQSDETKGKVESQPGAKTPIDRADEKAKGKEEVLFKDPFGVLSKLAAEAKDELKKDEPKTEKQESLAINEQRRPAPFDPFLADPGPIPKDASLSVALGSGELNGLAGDVLQSAHGDGDPANRLQDSGRPDALKASLTASDASSPIQMAVGGDTNASKTELERVKKDSPDQTRPPPTSSTQKDYELYKEGAKPKPDEDLENLDKAPMQAAAGPADAAKLKVSVAALKAEVEQLKAEVDKSLKDLPADFKPNIEIKATSDGLLISLTDDLKFSMFSVASAVPNPRLVTVMDRVSEIVTKHPGKIVVYGHTDGRPYKSGGYGNWRLSTDRAHMAYYMLVRGKVDETRFLRIEGYADRKLKLASAPFAAENRRIEILVMREVK